jgi:hypothetical protein
LQTTVRFRAGVLTVAGLAWVLAGCGLADYQERMKKTREKLEIFDRFVEAEKKYLTDPLTMPTLKEKDKKGKWVEKDALPFPIFVRPPQGVQTEKPIELSKRLLYFYEGSQLEVRRVFLAARDSKADMKAFLRDLNLSKDRQQPAVFKETLEGKTLKFDFYKLPFSYVEHRPDYRTEFYIYKDEEQGPVAIGYEVYNPKENQGLPRGVNSRETIDKAIDFSLKSLDIDRADLLQSLFSEERKFYKFRMESQ